MEQLHPIERCLQYPPLPGSYGPLKLVIEVYDTIRIGDHHNAQVVVVEVLTADFPVKGISQGQLVVAKLYDPMYINDDDFYVNPFLVADKGYTHETATYEVLSEYQGAAIPDYYGSYSLADTAAAITPGMLEYNMSYDFRDEVGDDTAEGLRRVVGF